MPRPRQPLDMDQLLKALISARRRGVPASRLISHAPAIIELLYPGEKYPSLTTQDRAKSAENLIVAAAESLGEQARHLSSILLCLTQETLFATLQKRREMAAEHMGVLPGTWERGWREPQLFDDLATQIYRLHQADPDRYIPETAQPA
ncbi:MAG: hypothetical protein ACRDSR_07225 [Pseudonocardiaceae bacterium]